MVTRKSKQIKTSQNQKSDLDNPIKHKDAITKICGLEAIHSVKDSCNKLFVCTDNTATKDFCDTTSSVLTVTLDLQNTNSLEL